MPPYIVILTTVPTRKEALKISELLLKKRLCACVNTLGGLNSKFWWKGKIDSAAEVLLLIKTKSNLYKAVEREIIKEHPYEVPEIIALPILAGNKKYLQWIKESARPQARQARLAAKRAKFKA